MKKLILTDTEYNFTLHCLEELLKTSSDDKIDHKWMDDLKQTRHLFNLELDFFNIRKDFEDPTKHQMILWLITKIKNKTISE
jgi:hypothetical protein